MVPEQDTSPVIVGVGQVTFRDGNTQRTPVQAMADASRLALADCGAPLLATVDCLVSVPSALQEVPQLAEFVPSNTASLLAAELGISPQLLTADVGGHLPQWFVNRCADRLVAGEYRAVLISGAELISTLLQSLRSGGDMAAWRIAGDRAAENLGTGHPLCLPVERDHSLFEPSNVYPLFESALCHARGGDVTRHGERIAAIVSAMSQVAASNPLAWKQRSLTPADVLSTADGNRMITFPYTKLMNAIIAVDMAAAVILTTAGHARAQGIPEHKLVYLQAGAEANDAPYFSGRVDFHSSPALRAVGEDTLAMEGIDTDAIDLFDIYSCFPSAVEVACDALGLAVDDARGLTVTGGLTLFGGPGNNYSLHAIATMVGRLRERGAGRGLVTANGGYLTKHAAGLYGTTPGALPWSERRSGEAQRRVDALTYPVLAAAPESGPMTIEAHAVRFKDGKPELGFAVGRLATGQRCIANCRDDAAALQRLVERDCVGMQAQVVVGAPCNHFHFADAHGV